MNDKDRIVQKSLVSLYTYESCQRAIASFKEVTLNVTKKEEQQDMITLVNNLLSYKDNPDIVELRRIIAKDAIQKNKYPF